MGLPRPARDLKQNTSGSVGLEAALAAVAAFVGLVTVLFHLQASDPTALDRSDPVADTGDALPDESWPSLQTSARSNDTD
jgi:hypothetical protein